MKRNGFFGAKRLTALFITLGLVFILQSSVQAISLDIAGKPLQITGYLNQSASYGIAGDNFDTRKGFQQALIQGLIETKYRFSNSLVGFVSAAISGDWAYPILSGDDEWNKKRFDESRDNLFFIDDFKDVLKECHITWTPGSFFFRIGKQIVSWGETDFIRLMDQINPEDGRRGITDIEFENSIIPIWLVRVEYFPKISSSWLTDLGFEFIFNPNVDFRANEGYIGNDKAGIWAPNIEVPGLPFKANIGSPILNVSEPDEWHNDGFEYGFRLKSTIKNETTVTLNYFYGFENSPSLLAAAVPPVMEVSPWDGRVIMHPTFEGKYKLQRLAGLTLSRDLSGIKSQALGGISPVIRVEALYGFGTTFVSDLNTFEEYDEIRWALGVDWKVRIPALNRRDGFSIVGQVTHRKIFDYPTTYGLDVEENSYTSLLSLSTLYLNSKLELSGAWIFDITDKSHLFLPSINYMYNENWSYKVGALVVAPDKGGNYDVYNNKDHIYFTISYLIN